MKFSLFRYLSFGYGLLLCAPAYAASSTTAAQPATSLPPTRVIDLGGGVTMEFVLIPAGSFEMGGDPNFSDGDETPQHRVTLTRPFYLGRTEVTQEQWAAIMGSSPSKFQGARLPVETVSWSDCQRFMRGASEKTGVRFALPTEAQWEFACRAGTSTRWSFGDEETALGNHAWIQLNAHGSTHPVQTKPLNPWGLADMYGNVWEWCADWYSMHYPAEAQVDPKGPATGDARVLRGGAWGDDATSARSTYRNSMGPDQRTPGAGFRCALLLEPEPATEVHSEPPKS